MKVTIRINLIKQFALIGILLSVLLSFNLWCGERFFPKVPVFDNFIGFTGIYDYINISVLIILIILSLFDSKRYAVILLLLWSIYLCIDDQNRLQPWFFMYNVILLVWLFYKKRVDEPNNYHAVFISMQFILAGVYIYSGLQKMNSNFVSDTYPWFISPLENLFSERQMNLFYRFGSIFAYIELLFGFLVLFKPLRFIILPLILFMHIIIIILLSPLGLNQNHVVIPWNCVMIILNLLLFANVKRERFYDFTMLFKTVHFYIVILIIFILPFFSFNNRYDSYLSSSLYSGNTNQISIKISQTGFQKLPFYVKHFTKIDGEFYQLNLKLWANTELGAPCIPEFRVFDKVIKRIKSKFDLREHEIDCNYSERVKLFIFKQ